MNSINTYSFPAFRILAILVAFFSIVPGYGGIFNINGKIIVTSLVVFTSLFFMKGISKGAIKYNKAFWIYLIVYNVQVLFDSGSYEAFKYFLQNILICLVIVKTVNSDSRLLCVIDMLAKGSLFVGIFGIIEAFSTINILHSLVPQLEFYKEVRLGILRIMTTFYHPISYGNYLIFIGSLILYRMQTLSEGIKRTMMALTYVVVVINMILTISRSTMIIFIFTQLVIAYKAGFFKWSVQKFYYMTTTLIILLVFEISKGNLIESIINIGYMFLSLIDSSYLSNISVTFGINTTGVGNRFDLYNWVYTSIHHNLILGMGTNATFGYAISKYQTKSSIEVEYLRILFIHGIVGAISLIISCIGTLRYLAKRLKLSKILGETVTFNTVAFITLVGYYLSFFAVNQSEDVKIYLIFVSLIIAYNHKKFKLLNLVR